MIARNRRRRSDPFESLVWEDRLVIGEAVIDVIPKRGDGLVSLPPETDDALVLHKPKAMIELYRRVLSQRQMLRPRQILELGIWKGGSTALWFELFQPCKIVAVDIAPECTNEAFARYLRERGAGEWLKPYWGVDQADTERLREIVEHEFEGPIDLVIDDASHLYGPTKASFETLFPRLRSKGLYCIEDWNWAQGRSGEPPGGAEDSLTRLIDDIMRAVGTLGTEFLELSVYAALAIVERGWRQLLDPAEFRLDDYVGDRVEPGSNGEAPR